jgi:hypothetical protein
MTIRRTIIVPAILALTTAGSIAVGATASATAAPASNTQVVAISLIHYYG